MPPKFHDGRNNIQHPLEAQFNAAGWDILSAIQKGFRAQVDVKGKLAEYFLYQQLMKLRKQGVLDEVEWRDQDGVPDFLVQLKGSAFQLECKNVRSLKPKKPTPTSCKVEIQKTRNQLGGGPKRGYRVDEFDVLAACLFNQTGQWEYLFTATSHLQRRPEHPEYLVIMQPVPYVAQGFWQTSLQDVLTTMLGKQ